MAILDGAICIEMFSSGLLHCNSDGGSVSQGIGITRTIEIANLIDLINYAGHCFMIQRKATLGLPLPAGIGTSRALENRKTS